MSEARPDWLLFVWLIADVVSSLILLGAASYAVFILNRSAWWIILAFFFSCCFGASQLYKALGERFGVHDS